MFDWTYKHLGVIEFIQSFGGLSRATDIYHSWPGFFAATAWLSDLSGIEATGLALWFTPLITLLTCLAIASLARRVGGGSPWVGIVAAWIFLMLNWIGQDYFSPQAVGLLLGVVVLRLALEQDRRAHLLALLPFAGIVVSHQLTPYWVVAIVWAFALTRRVHWWLPLALSVLAVGYFLINLDSLSNYGLFTGFNPVANAQTSGGGFSSDAKLFADWAARIAMVVMWLATLLALWRRRRGGRDWLVPAIVSFGPFIFLLAQSYGGEGLLRVALYSLVGCSAVLAPALIGALRAPRLAPAVATGTVAFLVGACAAQAYFGAWYTHQMPSAEVRVSSALQQQVPRPAYIAPLLPSWPSRNEAEYVDWVDRAGRDYDYAAFSVRQSGATYADPAELAALEAILRERAPWPSFLVISDRMETVNRYRTFLAPEAFANLRTKLPRRAGWSTVMTDGDVTVLRYVPAAARQEAASRWSAPS